MNSKKNKIIRELLGIEPFGKDCCTVFVKEFGAEDPGGRTFSLVNRDGSKTDIDKVLEDAFLLGELDMHFSLIYGRDYDCLKDRAELPIMTAGERMKPIEKATYLSNLLIEDTEAHVDAFETVEEFLKDKGMTKEEYVEEYGEADYLSKSNYFNDGVLFEYSHNVWSDAEYTNDINEVESFVRDRLGWDEITYPETPELKSKVRRRR